MGVGPGRLPVWLCVLGLWVALWPGVGAAAGAAAGDGVLAPQGFLPVDPVGTLVGALACALEALPGSTLLLAVPLFSRLDRVGALSHPLRRRIYESIRQRPGTSVQMLASQEAAGWSTVIYHLRVLERNGLVCGVRDGRHRRFFDATTGRWANGRKNVLAVLLNASTARVACMIRKEPGVAQRRLADRLDLAPSSLNWHVRRLLQVDLVSRSREKGRVLLHPGPAWEGIEEAGAMKIVHAVARKPGSDNGPSARRRGAPVSGGSESACAQSDPDRFGADGAASQA